MLHGLCDGLVIFITIVLIIKHFWKYKLEHSTMQWFTFGLYLFSSFSWQIEDQHAKERNENSRKDQIDSVEQGLSPDDDVEGNISLRGVVPFVDVQVGWNLDDVPSSRLPVIGQVHEVLVVVEGKGHLVSVEGPGAELHDAGLLVEGEVGDVDSTRTLQVIKK